MDTPAPRHADHPISPFFLERWSPRAFAPEPVSHEDLMTMLEAARWAASSSNLQPWRFVYARRDTEAWPRLLDLLVEGNRVWARDAGALVFVVSNAMRTTSEGKSAPSPTHSYDSGTASGYFTLQAHLLGFRAHGMYGFDHDRAMTVLRVPADHRVEAVYAVGRPGDPARLPERLRAREYPSGRRPLAELVFDGGFPE